MTSATPASNTLRIGVMLEAVQMSDIAGIDILGNLSTELVDGVAAVVPEAAVFKPQALNITWHFISSTLEPTYMTPGLHFKPTVTYDDCPRDLDIVIIGGPLPSHRPEPADRFIKEAWEKTRVWLTVCTGSAWLASAGVLAGRKATTNRGFLALAKQANPEVEWLDQRWVVDEKPWVGEGGKGELWTSGGANAGVDMIATYTLKNFDPVFVKASSLNSLDVDPTIIGQFYKD